MHPIGFHAGVSIHTRRARKKNPDFVKDRCALLVVLMEELGEAAQALQAGDIVAFDDELLDLCAPINRYYGGDMDRQLNVEPYAPDFWSKDD